MTEPLHEESTSAEIAPRRMPQQARSKERVDRILDAAAQLLSEEGYNAVKTNHIAKRAGVSIGSVYQFFPNRFAIFHALAERYRGRISEVLAQYIGPDATDMPWEQALDGTIDALADLWRTEWSFFAVWIAIQNTAELREPDDLYKNQVLGEYLLPFYRRILPHTSERRLAKIAGIVFDMYSLLLDSSMRGGAEQDREIVDELRLVVKGYLKQHVALEQVAISK
jgi:AcrR family transcriptional regulator